MTIQVTQDNNNEPFVLSDDAEIETDLTLAAQTSGASLSKGCALGEINTTAGGGTVGELVAVIGGATDGTQVTKYLLGDDVTLTTASQTVSGYTQGLFDENQISFGNTATTLETRVPFSASSGTNSTIKDTMRNVGIRVQPGISVSGYENS